jgi:hypothetical protein
MTAPDRTARRAWMVLAIATLGIAALIVTEPDFAAGHQQQDPLAEAFKGVTTKGTVQRGLFPIRSTGVSTAPVRAAADAYLASLTEEQRKRTLYAVDDLEWRKWNNVHRYARQGLSFLEMSEPQRERAVALLRASLSTKGLQKTQDAMRLNGHLAELMKNTTEYGEHLYHITIMGAPSDSLPWGWQLDGHHMIINYFVLRDQVVMTPTFMGAEPVIADSGRFTGTAILQDEERKGLALMQSLTTAQRARATIQTSKTANNALAQAFRDNLVLDYAGIRGSELNAAQRTQLVDLIGEYVNTLRDGHARVRMDEVRAHLDSTYFAWIGDVGADAVFYYRVQSPVVLIEFDHQTPVALGGPRVPGKKHIHTVVRTPNGNDYGKELLRAHYEAHRTDPAHDHGEVGRPARVVPRGR